MNAITLLFLTGVILLGFEVIVPGAVLGILGGLALLAGVVIAFISYGVSGGLGAAGVAIALVAIMLVIEFVVLPRTSMGKRMFLRTSITGISQGAPADETLIGRTAEALTPLVPSGFVSIAGRRYDAFSQSGPVSKGDQLRVIGVDSFRVIVTKS